MQAVCAAELVPIGAAKPEAKCATVKAAVGAAFGSSEPPAICIAEHSAEYAAVYRTESISERGAFVAA